MGYTTHLAYHMCWYVYQFVLHDPDGWTSLYTQPGLVSLVLLFDDNYE
jgi:hypothetical protein